MKNKKTYEAAKLLEDFKDYTWAIAEAHAASQLAVDFHERGNTRKAKYFERRTAEALRRAIEIERRRPRAANGP